MKSNFDKDISNETLLGNYLDTIYPKLFDGFSIKRIVDVNQQHHGIDLVISNEAKSYYIDEKAQLD